MSRVNDRMNGAGAGAGAGVKVVGAREVRGGKMPPDFKVAAVKRLLVVGAEWAAVEAAAHVEWVRGLKHDVCVLDGRVWQQHFGVAVVSKTGSGGVQVKADGGGYEAVGQSRCLWYVLDGKLCANEVRRKVVEEQKRVQDEKAKKRADGVRLLEVVEATRDSPAHEVWAVSRKDLTGRAVWWVCAMVEREATESVFFDELFKKKLDMRFDGDAVRDQYGVLTKKCILCRELTHQERLKLGVS